MRNEARSYTPPRRSSYTDRCKQLNEAKDALRAVTRTLAKYKGVRDARGNYSADAALAALAKPAGTVEGKPQ